jgi:putative methyltransferase (TIGR04325 family)
MDVRSLIRSLSPPILLDAARAARDATARPEWEWLPGGWDASLASGPGWEDESVLETLRARWPAFVEMARAHGPLGISPEAHRSGRDDLAAHNTYMVFAYVLARAAHGITRLSLLDWGGGLGHYGVLAQALLPEVTLEYHCRDTRLLARHGRTLLPDARFYDQDRDCLARDYDLVMASASLHYVEDWSGLLARLAVASRRFLCVTRLPLVERVPSYVAVQRPHRHGYCTEYQGWVINRGEFLKRAAAAGLALEREFVIDERPHIVRAPEPCRYRGFLLRPARSVGA